MYIQIGADNDYSRVVNSGSTRTFEYDGYSYLRIIWTNQLANTTFTYRAMLVKGSTALPYAPYREPITTNIPSAIQQLDGYGIGINEDCYNYIDFERKVYVQRVGSVDMGTIEYVLTANGFSSRDIAGSKYDEKNALCSKYYFDGTKNRTTGTAMYGLLNDKECCWYSNQYRIYIRDDDYTDARSFKQAIQGVMLYYKLETPIETDISDLLPQDFEILSVEAGGTVSFIYPNKENYAIDVPNRVEYLRKLSEVAE